MHQKPASEPDDAFVLPDVLPVVPLRDTVLFPYVILPLSVGSEESLAAVDQALGGDRLILLLAQRDAEREAPGPEHLHTVGTAGLIMRMLRLPDGRMRILVQGLARARAESLSTDGQILKARVARIESDDPPAVELERQALVRNVRDGLEKAVHLGKGISPEVMVIAANLDLPGRLADLTASNLELRLEDAQKILETVDAGERLSAVSDHLQREIELLTMQHQISSQAQEEIDRSQHEYFLRQQLKAIRDQLGESEDAVEEVARYRRQAAEKDLSDEARDELDKQLRRLERSYPESAEGTVLRTYLDWLTGLPWGRESDDDLDLDHARKVLDRDHYDLDKVKERIVELLAVRKLKRDARGPILCFVGPPGVGKSSLGRSIARALGRRFVRISLGGVRDEAEIRGHRRTYIGALPGRIIQGLQQAGTDNPVVLLDEIDKVGADARGDPSAALLEVLDPEQNGTFRDHYLGVPYDLSKVIFLATANLLDPIYPAFRDRMEVIRLAGYTEAEKRHIARRYLIPRQLAANGISARHVSITGGGLEKLIRGYTREAGLRNLEREIGAICRKVAVRLLSGKRSRLVVNAARVEKLLGPEKHFKEALLDRDRIGVATGLAWTAAGGDLLLVEVIAVPGKGRLRLTGQLGSVMKESAQTAVSYGRSFAAQSGCDQDFFNRHDVHVHVPAGSIPKDGPSAGMTIAVALISLLTGKPVARKIAMSGEITLRGEILPVGGVKDKALAARAAGIETLLLPALNRRDLAELPHDLRRDLTFHFLDHMDRVLPLTLAGWRPAEAAGAVVDPQAG